MAYYPKDEGRDNTSFDAVQLKIADEQTILDWSYGEVLKAETINYRTQKPERDGLFCEKIFGPTKDINPNDSKHRGIRSREAAVDKNGELVTKASSRRERMGHIKLASPVAHIWFMHDATSSPMKDILGMTIKRIERVVYYASYIITSVDSEKVEQLFNDNEAQFEAGKTAIKIRYDKASGEKDADLPKLADGMTKELDELTEKYEETKQVLSGFVKKALITENEYNNLPDGYEDLIEVGMGAEAICKLLEEIDLDELIGEVAEEAETRKGKPKIDAQKRLKTLEGLKSAGTKPKDLILKVVPVIPPDLRPMVQLSGDRFATSDLNDLYRRVINRNNRLKKLTELHAPEVIKRNEKRMLQEAVDALFDNSMTHGNRKAKSTNNKRDLKSLADLLRGKQGRFRQNLLGKRVDYSGRSVIVPGPELKIDQCGLPKKMALELFRPFVISKLLEWDQAHNIKSAQRLIDATDTVVWDALDEVIEGKYVLLNRAPTLHRLGIQAFKPKLIEGSAIQLHPLVTTGFNADFDGDQMAVHLPLSAEAQAEARDLMSATNNLLKPSDGAPVLSIYQDIILGAYYLTYDKPSAKTDNIRVYGSIDEAIMAKDQGVIEYQTPIKALYKDEIRETTLGRLLVNELLPEDFPFINEALGKKPLNKVMAQIFNHYGADVTAQIADDLKELTLEHATRSAVSTGMTDYFDIEGLDRVIKEGEKRTADIDDQAEMGLMTENERYRRTVETWIGIDDKVKDLLQEQLEHSDTAVSVLTNSGARGSLSNIKWATGMIGVTVDSYGHESEMPVKSSFKDGLTPLEQFLYTRSTRKGSIDTALKTANSGYLTRKLVDAAQDVFTVEDERGDDPGYMIYRSETEENLIEFGDRLYGRYTSEHVYGADGKEVIGDHDLITRDIADQIQNDESITEVKIMSILSTSQLKGIPQRSYGIDMATGYLVAEHEPVGVIAAQSVGEPGTQLTLNTFHLGGEAGGAGDITQGLPRVEELLEARKPKGEAILSEINGTITIIEDKEGEKYTIKVTPAKMEEERVKTKGYEVVVKNGDIVKAGEVIMTKEGEDPVKALHDMKVKVLKHEVVFKPVAPEMSKEYQIPASKMLKEKEGSLTLHDGDEVKAGDRLSIGSIDPHKLLEYKGMEATQRYIINSILRIYAAQGQNIADKHLEIIVRQMFSRVQVDDAGDSTTLSVGDRVSRATIVAENEELIAKGSEPAKYSQILTGIINVGQYSDSFLSAASFLNTTRILIKAASAGKIDYLRGLKENVIIGRKIPVGTGVMSEEDFYLDQTEGDSIDEIPEAI